MKVALICPDDISVVLFCKELVKALKNDGKNEIYIICDRLEENTDGYYTKILNSWGVIHVPIKFHRFINPLKDLKFIFKLYTILRNNRVDMVVNISTKPNIYGSIAARCAGIKKIVCSVWGMGASFLEKTDIKHNILKFTVLSLYWFAFKISSKVWFTNKNDSSYFVSLGLLNPEKLIQTNNYVNIDDYSSSSINKEKLLSLKEEFGLKEDTKLVIMVARMSWAKGVREYIEAAGIIKDKIPEVKFLLVGPTDEGSPDSVSESFLRENDKSDNFIWTGFRQEVKELYAMSDLAVLPSYYREGGFPRGLTEPMALNKPIITTDSVHCKGTVEEGKNGYLVPIKDSIALANAIEKILIDDNKIKEFGKYSRLKAENEFNEKVIISKVVPEFFDFSMKNQKTEEDERKEEEKLFHDKVRSTSFEQRWSPKLENTIKNDPLWVNMKYYSIERKSRKIVLDWFDHNCKDGKVLDYCCGNGEDSIIIAKNGAKEVIGIDISGVSIKNCSARAELEKVSDNTSFKVMDAEKLEFNDNTFDVVTEYGCLHHLDLEKAFYEISRVLKPNGKAICNEALGHNMAIHLYRTLTPHLRTKFETKHILKKKDIDLAKKYFNNIKIYFFHISTLIAVPLRNKPGFELFLTMMEFIDSLLLKIPFLKWQAWQVVFILSEPKKKS